MSITINKAEIANALHSVATEHVVAVATDLYDETREQYQSEVNDIVGTYEENPEFVDAHVDSSSKLLYGVKRDGDFYFGGGVPSQVKEHVEEYVDPKIESMDASIREVIDVSISAIDSSIQYMMPAVELVYDTLEYTENPEFVDVHLDSSAKVLYGVRKDGDFVFGGGVPGQVKNFVGSVVPGINPEFSGLVYYGSEPDATLNPSRYVNMSIAGIYTVNTTENSHIYFFVPSNMSYFYATMGGLKIPFTETPVVINNVSYRMYESINTYEEGVLDIMLA